MILPVFLGMFSGVLTAAAEGAADAVVPEPARVCCPYAGVDWEKAHHILTSSHMHVAVGKYLDLYYAKGVRFMTASNYYPSAPYHPLAEMRANRFRVRQEHGVMKDGVYLPGPIEWNGIVNGWIDELGEKEKKQLPFVMGKKLFPNVPPDLIEAPNAEHHSFKDTGAHINSPGSTFASGTFDARSNFKSREHGYCFGTGLPWREAFGLMLDGLMVKDGGGVTINHPVWSKLPMAQALEMLDYDPRVLGIEVYNDTSEKLNRTGWSEDYWDAILGTGRQCFGFFVPDHDIKGFNILLTPNRTAGDCLRAYRQGNFYGVILGEGLRFQSIRLENGQLTVVMDNPARIEFITKKGVVSAADGTSASFAVPADGPMRKEHVFLRVRASAQNGEKAFSQPFMLD
ncbi:MAG: hypothetical protein PHV34_11745 [Verrucomicrobiae bacterium]|nr:hypothetical protein [Verrucomicrobiae bacterium]